MRTISSLDAPAGTTWAAKKKLKAADCKLGKVKGERGKTAKVKKQSPKPDTVLPPGTKINVKTV